MTKKSSWSQGAHRRGPGAGPVWFCGHEHRRFALMQSIVELMPSPWPRLPIALIRPPADVSSRGPAGDLAALVFKTMADPYVGKLTYFRVYAGTLESDSRVYNIRAGEEERLGQLYTMRGKEQIPVARVPAGDIAAVARLGETQTGDTVCDRGTPAAPRRSFRPPLFGGGHPQNQSRCGQDQPYPHPPGRAGSDLTWRQEPAPARPSCLAWATHTSTSRCAAWTRPLPGHGYRCATRPLPGNHHRAATAQYRHKKQTGGLVNLPRCTCASNHWSATGFEFAWEVVGMNVSKTFGPSIEKGSSR